MTENDKDRMEEAYDRLVKSKDCEVCNPICGICQDICPCQVKAKSAFRAMEYDLWVERELEKTDGQDR